MKYPKCKNKMIKGVEICPKCGMKVTSIETVSSKKKKSKKLWIIILIINGLAIIGANSNNKSDDTTKTKNIVSDTSSSTIDTSSAKNVEKQVDTNPSSKKEDILKETVVTYHANKDINGFITKYNSFAEIKINKSDIKDAARNTMVYFYIGRSYVSLSINDTGTLAEITLGDKIDAPELYVAFRDITKTLNSSFSDDIIKSIWNLIKEGKYSYYSPYRNGGISFSCSETAYDNGNYESKIWLSC